MPVNGALSHIDISVGYPERSIPFYHALLTNLGYRRWTPDAPDFSGPNPRRAAWSMTYPGGATFGIECRPAREDAKDRTYDRYEPGPHHLAFHAESPEKVDELYRVMTEMGAEVFDPPADYSDHPAYGAGYYAVFFRDPDGQKIEVVSLPSTNP